MTHNAVEIPISFTAESIFAESPFSSVNSGTTIINTYILPSKQIFGPTTLAAPLVMRKEKWLGGQMLERPHFG